MGEAAALPVGASAADTTPSALSVHGVRRALIMTAAILAVNGWLMATSNLPWSSPRIWLGSAIIWVCAVPIISFAARPDRWYPLLPLICLGYLVGYGVPAFHDQFPDVLAHDPFLESDVIYACEVALLGIVVLVIGMMMPVSRLVSSRFLPWPTDDRVVARRFALAALAGGCLHVLTYANLVPQAIAQPVLVVAVMTEIGALVVFGLWLRKKAPFAWCFVALCSLLPVLAIGFGSGLLWNLIRPLMILVVGYYGFRRRIPWGGLLILAAIFIPANQVKMEFRYEMQQRHVEFLERPVLFAKLVWQAYAGEAITLGEASENAAGRLDHVAELAHVVSLTPGRIPYWDGETYATLLYAPIPRFIMPNKPTKELGQAFGHRYELIDESNYDTSVNLGQLTETYVNFGLPGVAIGMFLIGMLAASISALFESKKPSLVTVAVGSGIAIQLFNIESDFALVYGGLMIELPVIWLMMHGLTWLVPRQPRVA
jgi:hypothetical protein